MLLSEGCVCHVFNLTNDANTPRAKPLKKNAGKGGERRVPPPPDSRSGGGSPRTDPCRAAISVP